MKLRKYEAELLRAALEGDAEVRLHMTRSVIHPQAFTAQGERLAGPVQIARANSVGLIEVRPAVIAPGPKAMYAARWGSVDDHTLGRWLRKWQAEAHENGVERP